MSIIFQNEKRSDRTVQAQPDLSADLTSDFGETAQPCAIISYAAALGAFNSTTSVQIPTAVPSGKLSSATHPATMATVRPQCAFCIKPTPAASASPNFTSSVIRAKRSANIGHSGPCQKR